MAWALAVGTVVGPVHLHFQFVSKAGRGSLLWSSYKDTSEGGTLWDPLTTKMQLQSKADFLCCSRFLSKSAAGSTWGQKDDTSVGSRVLLFYHTGHLWGLLHGTYLGSLYQPLELRLCWWWDTHMDFQGRQRDPRSHLERGGLGLWTLFMPIFGSSVNSQRVHVFSVWAAV